MIQLCGLWLNTSKSGKKTLSGNLGGARILLLKNNFKSKDEQPDYHLYIVERQKKGSNDETSIVDDLQEVSGEVVTS